MLDLVAIKHFDFLFCLQNCTLTFIIFFLLILTFLLYSMILYLTHLVQANVSCQYLLLLEQGLS